MARHLFPRTEWGHGGARRLSRAEALLWEDVTRGMAALPGRRIEVPPEDSSAKVEPFPSPRLRPHAPVSAPASSHGRRRTLENGVTDGIDKRTAERFLRGRMEIDARIDLHGMTEARAHEALRRFLGHVWHAGLRNVLVITGKGTRDGGMGVLRAAVPRWLNEPDLRDKVLSFCCAQPRDGGEGALYLLLKRQRG